MIYTDSQIQGLEEEFKPLEKTMKKLGFVRWTWDFHKVTYDKKYSHEGIDYYLRIPGDVINDKELEHPKALVKLSSPVFARHFFPHGLDDHAEVPEVLRETVNSLLHSVHQTLSK